LTAISNSNPLLLLLLLLLLLHVGEESWQAVLDLNSQDSWLR
jgi:hypothetical protein